VIADRLDAMGIDAARVQADLDRTLKGAAEPATEADLAEYSEKRAPQSGRRKNCSAR
jgi:hypothetical protein